MKTLFCQLIITILFVVSLQAGDTRLGSLTRDEITEIQKQLKAYERGAMTVEDLTEDKDRGFKLIAYYLSNSNAVTTKMKLPISRCFVASGKYAEAAELAGDYVGVYSNDWHGWKLLGAANGRLGNFDQALRAVTNAVNLGDEGSLGPLAYVSLKLKRFDLFEKYIPRLLILKRSKPTQDVNPLDIVTVLVVYSLKADKQDMFIKALDGVDAGDVLSRKDLTFAVREGCERFKAKETESLCQKIAK